jgi:hypothetical protein
VARSHPDGRAGERTDSIVAGAFASGIATEQRSLALAPSSLVHALDSNWAKVSKGSKVG